jgi:hypothetical protein
MATADPQRRRDWTGRVVREGDDERRIDAEFWKQMTGDERIAIVWDMTVESEALRTGRADQPRLQRSVVRVQRS